MASRKRKPQNADPIQMKITGEYCDSVLSDVSSSIPSDFAWAIRMRSKGSLCTDGKEATAILAELKNSSLPSLEK